MHEMVVRSPIRYMGACTSVHAHNQSRAVHWNHAPKSFMQQTNHGALRAGWKPKVQPNKTPCIIVSWLRWACTTPPSRTKTSWATNHPLKRATTTWSAVERAQLECSSLKSLCRRVTKEHDHTSDLCRTTRRPCRNFSSSGTRPWWWSTRRPHTSTQSELGAGTCFPDATGSQKPWSGFVRALGIRLTKCVSGFQFLGKLSELQSLCIGDVYI
jgi:hypothetical protein